MKLIGIHGPAQSGKGTCAAALVARGWNQIDFADALRRAVAGALGDGQLIPPDWSSGRRSRQIAEAVWIDECKTWTTYPASSERIIAAARVAVEFGADAGIRFARWLNLEHRTLRQILQYFGTEIGRAHDLQHWIKQWINANALCAAHHGGRYDRTTGLTEHAPGFVDGVVVTDVRFPNEAGVIRASRGIVVRLDAPWAGTPKDGIAGHASDAQLPDELVDVVVPVAPFGLGGDWNAWARGLQRRFLEAVGVTGVAAAGAA